MRTIRFGVVLAILCLSATGGATATVVQASTPLDLTGPKVVHYKMSAAPSAHRMIVQGKRNSRGGCDFHVAGRGSGSRKQLATMDELAFDPTTCRSLMAGSVRLTRPPAVPTSGGSPMDLGLPGAGASGGRSKLSPATINASVDTFSTATCSNPYASGGFFADSACIHSWFQDPVGITVNALTNEVQWTPNGCANAGTSYSSWYNPVFSDGWYRSSNTFDPQFTCFQVASENFLEDENDIFCVLTSTVTDYDPQFIGGMADGSYRWSYSWSKFGLCEGLLSFHSENS